MRKILILTLCAIIALTITPLPAIADGGEYTPAMAGNDPETDDVFGEEPWVDVMADAADAIVASKSLLVMEKITGTVVSAHNEHERLAPASVTKVMTMLLIAEAIDGGNLNPDDVVTASANASGMGGSQIYLKENERMTVRDLLKSVAVSSANDASVALAEYLSGTEQAFVAKMNARAKELGMNDTVFANSTGLPTAAEHLTSAYDIAVMSRELIRHEFIREFTTIWTDTVRGGEFGLSNTNKLIRFYPGATGLKTGFTSEAMYCLSATAERGGVEFIAVIMGAPTSDQRFDAAKALLNSAFADYTLVDTAPSEPIAPALVPLGKVSTVQPVLPSGSEKLLITKDQAANLSRVIELYDDRAAPIEKGQEIGRLKVLDPTGRILADVPLAAGDSVGKLSWTDMLLKYLYVMFTGNV
ncbi:MAG: D-alanyl-D-alanine carboxypeptidase [Oscillospiraceae bacterium]|jgi:D-alanyl-D-alanine carboxypeptidase (penicillin-binding protein 5/6)|nr:D-alanyl-D-alanine carboxypeptidase [Oscillospiraceae bacterium]